MRPSLWLILTSIPFIPVWGQPLPQGANPQWAWLQQIGGLGYENVVDMAPSPDGGVVLLGTYEDRKALRLPSRDGRTREIPVSAVNHPLDATSMWLARYRADGSLHWSARGLAEQGFSVRDLHTDAQGNILVCGQYRGQMWLHPGVGEVYSLTIDRMWLISSGGSKLVYNPFVAKFSPEGKLLWFRTGFAREDATAFQVLSDQAGNVYARLYNVRNSLSLSKYSILPDRGPDGYNTRDNVDNHTVVVVKYSPAGEEQWVMYGGGSIGIKEMQVSSDGRVSMIGQMSYKIRLFHTDGSRWRYDFPPTHPTHPCEIRLDPDGRVIALDTTVAGMDKNLGILKTVRDRAGDRYLLFQGTRNGTIWPPMYQFTWQGQTYQSQRDHLYLAKVSADGSPLWLVRFSGKQDGTDLESRPYDLVLDAQQQPIVAGWFHRRMQITTPEGGEAGMLSCPMGFSLFVARFTAEGKLLHAEPAGTACFQGIESLPRLSLAPGQDSSFWVCGQVNRATKVGGYALAPVGQGRIAPGDTELCFDYPDVFLAKYGTRPDPPLVPADTAVQDTQPLAVAPPQTASPPAPPLVASAPVASDSALVLVATLPLDLLLFPNPVTQQQRSLSTVLTLTEATTLRWEITDLAGRVLLQRESRCSGACTEEFSFEGLPAGVYTLTVRSRSQQATRRVVVL